MSQRHIVSEISVPSSKYTKYIIWALPALLFIPLLDAPVGTNYVRSREIAGAFQSLAYLEHGLASFTIVTPLESLVSLHLHALLSAPFVALGYAEAGRLVSLCAAIVATVTLGAVGERLWGRTVGFLAPLLLWTHPFFARFAWGYMPEAVSFALTIAAILCIIRYHESDRDRYLWLTAVVFALAVANHMWEATILLPIVTVLVYRREWVRAVAMTVFGFGIAGGVYALTHLQPQNATDLVEWQRVGYDAILTLGYWVPDPALTFEFVGRLLFPMAVVATCAWGIYIWQRGLTFRSLIVGSWLLSGLSIHFLLPHYHVNFVYSYWSLLPSVVISVAIAGAAVIEMADRSIEGVSSGQLLRVASGMLLISASVYIGVFEVGVVGHRSPVKDSVNGLEPGETIAAGYEVRALGVQDASKITFVGRVPKSSYGIVPRVLIYAQIVPQYGLNINPRDANAPDFVDSRAKQTECAVMVIRDGDELSVERCQ